MPMVEGLRPVRRDGFPDVFGGTAPGERGRRVGFGCPRWQLRRQGVAVALANLVAAAAVNVGLFLLVFRVLTPRADPDLAAGRWCGGRWGRVAGPAGRRWLPGRPLYLRHTSQVYGVFAIVLGLLFWLYLGARLTLYAAEVNVVAARRLWPAQPAATTIGQHQRIRRSG